ncbi:MAG: hypothetical protein WCF23_08160 [Candidatus Nitrosopolaris sp.]
MESETEKRVREYWAKAYDADAKNKNGNRSIYHISSLDFTKNNNDDELPFKPTAIISNPKDKRISLRDIVSLDFSR